MRSYFSVSVAAGGGGERHMTTTDPTGQDGAMDQQSTAGAAQS